MVHHLLHGPDITRHSILARRELRELRRRPCPAISVTYMGMVRMLTARRKALGLSQLELDDRAGFQDGYTGKLELGDRIAQGHTLEEWCRALSVGIVLAPLMSDEARHPPADGLIGR